jgi:hypothetical protein
LVLLRSVVGVFVLRFCCATSPEVTAESCATWVEESTAA